MITGKNHKPFVSGSSANSNGLNIPFNRSRKPKFESADISDGEIFALQLPARLFQSKAMISVFALESRKARRFSVPHSSKKTLIGSIQPLNDILKNFRAYFSVFREGCLEFGKLLNLVKAGDRAFVLSVDNDTLLKGSIIEVPTEVKPILRSLNSLRICLDTVSKRLLHLLSTIFSLAYFKIGGKPYQASLSVSQH
jgi:hypothetical protein